MRSKSRYEPNKLETRHYLRRVHSSRSRSTGQNGTERNSMQRSKCLVNLSIPFGKPTYNVPVVPCRNGRRRDRGEGEDGASAASAAASAGSNRSGRGEEPRGAPVAVDRGQNLPGGQSRCEGAVRGSGERPWRQRRRRRCGGVGRRRGASRADDVQKQGRRRNGFRRGAAPDAPASAPAASPAAANARVRLPAPVQCRVVRCAPDAPAQCSRFVAAAAAVDESRRVSECGSLVVSARRARPGH